MEFADGEVGGVFTYDVVNFYIFVLTDTVYPFVSLKMVHGIPRLLNEYGGGWSGYEVETNTSGDHLNEQYLFFRAWSKEVFYDVTSLLLVESPGIQGASGGR